LHVIIVEDRDDDFAGVYEDGYDYGSLCISQCFNSHFLKRLW